MFLAKVVIEQNHQRKQSRKIRSCTQKSKKLERIYGVRFGSNNMPGTTVGEKNSFTQEDIAQKMGLNMEITNIIGLQIIVSPLKRNLI